jgi:hypothetical protein
MVQAPEFDGLSFDPFSSQQDGLPASEGDVGWGEIIEALVITPVVVSLDEGRDLGFAIAGQEVVLQQDAVLERLMPALDLALCLRMARCTTGVIDVPILKPFRQLGGNVSTAHCRKAGAAADAPSPYRSPML